MKEKYFKVRSVYKDAIIFVKSGHFYNCFFGDAVMIHYLTGYKIVNGKVVFPSKVLSQVLSKVNQLHISYILVYEFDRVIKYIHPSNSYTFYLDQCMKMYQLDRRFRKELAVR